MTYLLRLFDFWNFFAFPFSPFLFFFAAVIDFLLGLLAVEKLLRKRQAIFSMKQPGVVAGNFALSFSLNFLNIFVHI